MNNDRIRIGIDLGWTVKGHKPTNERDLPAPDSFRVISEFVSSGYVVYIISKVTSEQKERAEKWLAKHDFFNVTGVKPENLYFCFERRDKALFVDALGIKIMIDDRAEVMAHLDYDVIKFLINPDQDDLQRHKEHLFNTKIVKDWLEIEKSIIS